MRLPLFIVIGGWVAAMTGFFIHDSTLIFCGQLAVGVGVVVAVWRG